MSVTKVPALGVDGVTLGGVGVAASQEPSSPFYCPPEHIEIKDGHFIGVTVCTCPEDTLRFGDPLPGCPVHA